MKNVEFRGDKSSSDSGGWAGKHRHQRAQSGNNFREEARRGQRVDGTILLKNTGKEQPTATGKDFRTGAESEAESWPLRESFSARLIPTLSCP